jgi:hypothetical protein
MIRMVLLGAVAAGMFAIIGVGSTAEAASPSSASIAVRPSAAPVPMAAPSGPGQTASVPNHAIGAVARAATYCEFGTYGDNVHHSATAGDVSGHGWWVNINCPSGTKAKVTIWLQEYYSDHTWHTKNQASKTVYSGGGSSNWANARKTCQGSNTVGWRTVVDVDLVNISDSDNIWITPTQNLACRVN